MEISVIAGMSGLASFSVANPPLVSRLLSIFELGRFSAPQTFWKWGALFLALLYTFSSVASKIKILVVRRHRRLTSKLYASSEPLSAFSDDDDCDFSDEEAEDDARSSCSSEGERREVDPASSSYEDFCVAGCQGEKKRKLRILPGDNFSSLGELVSGKGVVKLWDGLGFGLDIDVDTISIFDLDKEVVIGSITGRIPAVSVSPSSPRVVFTGSAGDEGRVGLSSWDMRVRQRRPTVDADWRDDRWTGPAVLEFKADGMDKIYIRDGVSGNMTVADLRKARSPLVNATENQGDEWFESNAVSETEEE